MDKTTVQQVIIEQRELFEVKKDYVERKVPEEMISSEKIIVITGIRRCGKSTLLKQLSKRVEHYAYINFEDERLLNFSHEDFNMLLEVFMQSDPNAKTFFFDEIQNVFGWEKFVRRLFTEGYKVFVTGSNAKLLSSEIATSLTGRNMNLQLYPFTFIEFLAYNNFKQKNIYTTKERAILATHLNDYLAFGGMPEIVKSHDLEELSQIYRDILVKDLLVRFKIRDAKDFRELSLYLLSNVSSKISYNNLKTMLEFSATSKVKKYVDYLIEAYLFYTIPKFDYSLKKQIVNDKKVYAADTGIINAVGFAFTKNTGRVIENVVFLELLRRGAEIYYHQSGKECDFLVRKGRTVISAVQVTTTLEDSATRKREIEGLYSAMNAHKLDHGTIIIADGKEGVLQENKKIKVIPLWKFLLGYDEL
jgi:predicted AAA+ superfamily ATPase